MLRKGDFCHWYVIRLWMVQNTSLSGSGCVSRLLELTYWVGLDKFSYASLWCCNIRPDKQLFSNGLSLPTFSSAGWADNTKQQQRAMDKGIIQAEAIRPRKMANCYQLNMKLLKSSRAARAGSKAAEWATRQERWCWRSTKACTKLEKRACRSDSPAAFQRAVKNLTSKASEPKSKAVTWAQVKAYRTPTYWAYKRTAVDPEGGRGYGTMGKSTCHPTWRPELDPQDSW